MISTILGAGAVFGGTYGIIFIIFLAIGLWKYGYEEKGFWRALREVGTLFFCITMILAALIAIMMGGFAFFHWVCIILAKTEQSFIVNGIFFTMLAIVFGFIGFVSYELMKACDIDYKKEEKEEKEKQKIQNEKLLYITKQEEENIKDLVGGWYYWDRMDNHTKNKYIKEYRIK